MRTKSKRFGCRLWYQCEHCLVLYSSKEKLKGHGCFIHKSTKSKLHQTKKEDQTDLGKYFSQPMGGYLAKSTAKGNVEVKPAKVLPELTLTTVKRKFKQQHPQTSSQTPPKECLKRKLEIVLDRLRLYEILVTTPSAGMREVYYRGAEDGSKRTKFSEWRLERVAAINKKDLSKTGEDETTIVKSPQKNKKIKHESDDNHNHTPLVLEIPAEFPFVFNIGSFKDDVHSILDLLTGQKITTVILDAAIALLVEQVRKQDNKFKRKSSQEPAQFEHLSLQFLPVFARDQCIDTIEANMRFLPSLTKNTVLIAPIFTCKHFYLAVFDFRTHHIRVYDSCWHFVSLDHRSNQVMRMLKYLVNDIARSSVTQVWTITFMENCCQQIDEYSCGSYVIKFAKNELEGKQENQSTVLTKTDLLEIRRNVVANLLSSTKTGSLLLEALTE